MGVVELGEPSRYCCLIRVAHRIILPNRLYNKHTTKNIMRSFIILICVGVALAGEDMFGMKKMQKQWAEHKAMESCFGENMMKTSLLKMKKAVVKCTGMDMPELDLPMYNNPHRFVHALLEGAEDLKTMKMFKAMSVLSGQQYNQQSQNAPIQLVLGQQQAPQDNMMKKMFMKMMMKKMFQDKEADESPFGNMGSMKYGQEDNQDQYKFFQNMMKAMNRNKRATDDLFELGDRLTDKLKQETEEWQAKLGNASCVLKELDINDCRTCATFADSIPKTVFEECAWGEKWGRIMMFFQCEKDTKYKTCMNHDMKLKLEKSFGSLESLEEATGLPEYQLLPMTMKLLNEQMDMFM